MPSEVIVSAARCYAEWDGQQTHIFTDDEADMRIASLPTRADAKVCSTIAAAWHAGVSYGMEHGKEQALYSVRAALGITQPR